MMTVQRLLGVMLIALAVSALGLAQEGPGYAFDLPQDWEELSFTDGAEIRRVEYVYGDRSKALLKVKRVRLEPGQTLEAAVAADTDSSLRFMQGYVAGKSERFAGGVLSGYLVQFDFTKGGRPMLGRYYYLAGAEGTVWTLQFTGERSSLSQLRNVTDQIGRSFREK